MHLAPRLLLMACLLLTAGPVNIGSSAGDEQTCTPHEPIGISEDFGDGGFEWINPVTGQREYRPGSGVVAGDGTAEDPYRIEGWCITDTIGDPIERRDCKRQLLTGVSIYGTTKHWVIANTTISAYAVGLRVMNISAGTGAVETTTLADQWACSLTLTDAPAFHVRRSNFTTTAAAALGYPQVLYHITDDWDDHDGTVQPVEGLTVSDSTFSPATYDTLWIRGDNLTVEGSSFPYGYESILSAGDGSTFRENSFGAVGTAIYAAGSNLTVANNTFRGTRYYGVLTWGGGSGSAVAITGNVMEELDGTGITVDGYSDVFVDNNRVAGSSSWAVGLFGTTDARISNLTADGADHTIALKHSANVTVEYVNLSDAWVTALHVEDATGVELSKSNFHPNGTDAAYVSADADPVTATGNWWGCPEGPGQGVCDPVRGEITVDPWLSSPVADAGSDV